MVSGSPSNSTPNNEKEMDEEDGPSGPKLVALPDEINPFKEQNQIYLS